MMAVDPGVPWECRGVKTEVSKTWAAFPTNLLLADLHGHWVSKIGAVQVGWHNFTNSQPFRIIFAGERDII